MGIGDSLQNALGATISKVKGALGNVSPAVAGAAIAGGVGVGAGLAGVAALRKRRKKTAAKKSRKKKGRKLKFGSKAWRRKYSRRRKNKHRTSSHGRLRYHSHRKRPSGKGIHYTKHGQPYIILSSGKARFVSKRGARASRKRKGGRY